MQKKTKAFKNIQGRIKSLICDLDIIHDDITSGKKLSIEEMKEMLLELDNIKSSSVAEWNALSDGAKNAFRNLVISKLLYLVPAILILIVSFASNVVLGVFYAIYSIYDTVQEFLAEHNENVRQDTETQYLYKQVEDRVINYNEILVQRIARENTHEENPNTQSDNEVMLANNCINLVIDYEMDLDFIPENVKNMMVMILQQELGVDDSDLSNLIGYAIKKVNDNSIKKGRYV